MEDLDAEFLPKLSPHRVHESSWLKSLPCSFGVHRWYETEFGSVPPQKVILCLWCTRGKLR
jgi:hypothetical protein